MLVIIMILHVLVSVALVALVLLQRGKGAEMGAAFGAGASGTMFGSQGSTPFMVKLVGGLAVIFFCTSLGLNYVVSQTVNTRQPDLLDLTGPGPAIPNTSIPNTPANPQTTEGLQPNSSQMPATSSQQTPEKK